MVRVNWFTPSGAGTKSWCGHHASQYANRLTLIRVGTPSTLWCMAGTARTSRARALGAALRTVRDDAGLTVRELGIRLGISHSVLSRWESGQRVPTAEQVAGVLGALAITGDERDALLEMAREAGERNLVAPGLNDQLAALLEFERTATRITAMAPLLIPGLLQTADYARTILKTEALVALRMGRRDVITRDNPVEYMAIIGETALREPIGTPIIMAAQLRQLVKLGTLPNVTVQVLRSGRGYHPGLAGPFVILEFPAGARPIVHLEHYRSALFLDDQRDAEGFRSAADTVLREAMSPDESSEFIIEIANEMEPT